MNRDDELILHYYGDGLDAGERARIDAALRDDPALALRYLELTAELDRLRLAPDAAPPASAVHRWQTSLARAARLEAASSSPPRRRHAWWTFAGAALASMAVLAIALITPRGIELEPHDAPRIDVETVSATPLQRGVQMHLHDIGELAAALAGADGVQRLGALADVIERNRLYERAAEAQDAERLARLLRAFEPTLQRLADTDPDDDAFEAERERLAFEVGIAQARLTHSPTRLL